MPDEITADDVIVVGSGAAGLMAAVSAGRASVALITDRGLGTSNSAVAQGGLQLPDVDQASIDRFRDDMLRSGGEGIDRSRLDHFVGSVREVVLLLCQWGLRLDRADTGDVLKISAGGLSEPRIVTSGDRIGSAILKVLRDRVAESDVTVHTRTKVLGLTFDERSSQWIVDTDSGSYRGSCVVIATGGRAYEHARETGLETSNPSNDNGRMHRLLRDLGVAERDADAFQFHPYGIIDEHGSATGKCVPESISSLGAYVADRDGNRLAPIGATRAVLTDAMRRCMADGRGEPRGSRSACLLVMDDVDETRVTDRYPHLGRHLAGHLVGDRDIAVRPVVHYQLGGFVVAPDGSTDLPGLFLAGEITGGLHGVNRLMGNGITEAVVDGWTAGQSAELFLRR